MSDYLDHLAEFVVTTRLEHLADSTVEAAKKVVLDTLGAVLAGSRWPENANFAGLAQELSGSGTSTLFGHSGKVRAPFAAMVNATAGVALEMDEGSRLGGGHPSVHVTPGAIAVGEELGRSGKEVLESIVIGYEVTSRIGSGTRVRTDVHSHGTWGTIGAAAATAKLMRFNPEETRQTMSLAMSMSPANTWTPCFEGATIRNLYPGRSSFQGIMAAHLLRCGFTGVRDGPADLYNSLLGEGFNAAAVVDGLVAGGPLRIEQNYIKLHACCLYNHPVLDAVLALMNQGKFTAAEVAAVDVTAPAIVQTMIDPEPKNMLSAKFSIPYAVAVAIATGTTDMEAFYDDRIADPKIRELAKSVKVIADPDMSLRRYDYPAAKVQVTLKNGRIMHESVIAHQGDFRNPISNSQLIAKFLALSEESLGKDKAQQVIESVDHLQDLKDIKDLTRDLGKD